MTSYLMTPEERAAITKRKRRSKRIDGLLDIGLAAIIGVAIASVVISILVLMYSIGFGDGVVQACEQQGLHAADVVDVGWRCVRMP